ncbi:SDR family oxidoreductase [Pedobacter sp. MC2016-14]|uniref:SDR family oxidoreductase n=1 Tax=Pedobacter sp. MC2016-14 TaxID=2897327 RepID=UPI001E614F82|nr:SDR family oxidoreductase [Pedobacter sp. MC2016-14]MCD0489888.1 SDR family oxidoreductase [Pedobacter sp. MC2016-14]
MKVFVTGATGFIGAAVVKELINAGHQVIGLARSEASAKAASASGAEVLMGSLEDLEILKQGALQADGVIHTAFIHDFTQYAKANETDKSAIQAIGEALKGTDKPFVVTAGILGLPKTDGFITEVNLNQHGPRSSEATALSLAAGGVYASVLRLPPSVHDKGDKGFVPFMIAQAIKNGVSAYPNEGNNHWPAVHRLDVAKLFRLAVEKPRKGALYNAIGETGIPLKNIAALIAEKLNLPLVSLNDENIAQHFEWMSAFINFDSPATSLQTQQELEWQPKEINLLHDMEEHYF